MLEQKRRKEDDEIFEEKMNRLTSELAKQMEDRQEGSTKI